MISRAEATARVARGAAHLDAHRPGWHERIDIGTLTISDPCYCIVGQLCGTSPFAFKDGAASLGAMNESDRVAFGFDLDHVPLRPTERESFYQPLQDAWVSAIADRRGLSVEQDDSPGVGVSA